MQLFDFEIKYKKGTENPADALSSLSIQSDIEKLRSVTDEYVNFIIETRSQSIDIDKIRHVTLMDDTLNLVIKALKDNSWPKNSLSLHPFSKILQELCVKNNILLKKGKIVLPKTLHKKALSLVHQNHWGIEKTKQMIRKSFWWPKMNNDVEHLIKTC